MHLLWHLSLQRRQRESRKGWGWMRPPGHHRMPGDLGDATVPWVSSPARSLSDISNVELR